MPARYQLQALSIGWVLSITSSSLRVEALGSLGKSRAVAPNPLLTTTDAEDVTNESFKDNSDWWKDPFAMFDADDDEDDDEDDGDNKFEEVETKTQGATYDDEDDDELLLFSEPELPEPPPPVVKKVIQPVVVVEKKPEPVAVVVVAQKKKPEGRRRNQKQNIVNPLVEQAVAAAVAPEEEDPTPDEDPRGVAMGLSVVKFGALLRNLPFAQVLASFAFIKVFQPVMEKYSNEQLKQPKKKRATEDEEYEDLDEEEERLARHKKAKRGASSAGWLQRVFGESKEAEKLPPARDLMDQVEFLQQDLATIKGEKESMEREYEKASWQVSFSTSACALFERNGYTNNIPSLFLFTQLQESQNELATLHSSTNYLKTQLRDNQEVMDRAVRAERRKARDELTKMKEAMLQVLQRERQELRAKMMKQTADVQAILKEREAANSPKMA